MPFPIHNLLVGRSQPLCISPSETAAQALDLMVEHDYSQLPIVERDKQLIGMVTTESILRAVRTFQILPDKFSVRDCQIKPSEYSIDAELFEVLEGLEAAASVVVVDREKRIVGMLTDYDMAAYFSQRAENAMLVEDIEGMLQGFIRLAFPTSINVRDDVFEAAVNSACVPDRDRERLKSAIGSYLTDTKGQAEKSALFPLNEDALDKAFTVLSSSPKEKTGQAQQSRLG